MPINPNIALGVQQQQPVNMLGQMGQVMALRAAQQEIEGNEGVKSYFARPSAERGNPTDLAQYGRQGRETLKALNESQIKQLEADQKRINLVGAGAGAVLNNPTMETFTTVVSDLVKRGIYTPEQRDQAFAAIGNDPSKIKSFVQPIFDQAISAEKRLADITSRRNQDVASGASYLNAQLNREKFNDERLRGRTIAGENQFLREDIYGNLSPVGSYGTQFGPNAPAAAPVGGGGAPALPPAAANAFVTSRPSVNNLVTQPNAAAPSVVQPGSPTVANAAAIAAQQNIPRPPARAGYKYNEQGQLVKVLDEKPVWNDKAQVWMTPPTAENPQGTVTEAPAVQKAVQERTANATLKVAGYDPKTQTDEVSRLIKQSTSGLAENWANKVWSAISGTGSKGAEAIAQLETRANEMTLALAPNGSLGAGFSNEDRTFMLGKLGDVANPDKPMNVRLAAWEDVMERTARTAGVPYTKQSFGSSNASGAKTVTKTGTFNGRKVVQYSDGTTAYAD
jgi:hypothetical protein